MFHTPAAVQARDWHPAQGEIRRFARDLFSAGDDRFFEILFRDGDGFVLRITGIEREEIERIPPSPGDRLLHAHNNELGLSERADLLLKGEELVIPTTRHRWPLP